MLNILITGANGQLGSSLRQLGSVSPNNYLATDVAELDITDAGAVLQTVKEQRIDVIVNCAAYTNVERAEEDEARADLLNHKAAAYLAAAAKETGATLIHVSTDYVFDAPTSRWKAVPWICTSAPCAKSWAMRGVTSALCARWATS